MRVTPQLLKARSGEFALESILLLKLRGLGLVGLGCLGDCLGLEWLDLSGNALTQLGPLASLRQLAVLNVADNRLTGLEPLAACENLQCLNAAGNLLAGPAQLQCLAGLRGLERLRLRDPLARLSNPLCASPCYWASVRELLPGLKVIITDGEGNVLLQRRAITKYHSGGLWTNACCSHPVGDVLADAKLRLMEELGVQTEIEEVGHFVYRHVFENGMTEYEFDHVLLGRIARDTLLFPDPAEADATQWMSVEELEQQLTEVPEKFTPWFITAAPIALEVLKKKASLPQGQCH